MTEQRFQDYLYMLLQAIADTAPTDEDGELLWPALKESDDIQNVRSFADDQVLTSNKGVTVRLADGTEYQLTIVKSR